MTSDVTIVIPTFNRAELVNKAIDSALSQTYPCQVVVCDHGSTDNTPEIVSNYDDRVLYIRREKDFGPHFCWLEGVLHADAKYIHIQYDDDWIADTFIEKTMALMEEKVGMVMSNVKLMYLETNEEKRNLNFFRKLETGIHSNKFLERKLVSRRHIVSPGACLFRKKDVVDALYQGELPLDVGCTYHGVGPDYWMSVITLLRYNSFGYIDEELAFFGVHDGSITIDSATSSEKKKNIKQAYRNVRIFYKIMRYGKQLYKVITKFTK